MDSIDSEFYRRFEYRRLLDQMIGRHEYDNGVGILCLQNERRHRRRRGGR